MRRIFEALQSLMASIRTVLKPVLRAGRWTLEATTEVVAAVGRPMAWVADTALEGVKSIVGPAAAAIEWGVELPGRAIGALFRRPTAAGQQAQAAADQVQQQVAQQQQATQRAVSVHELTRRFRLAAAAKSRGEDWTDYADALPPKLVSVLDVLEVSECRRVEQLDARAVAAWLRGTGELPGVPSVREIQDMRPMLARAPRCGMPSSAPAHDADQATSILAAKLVSMGRKPRQMVANDDDWVPAA